MKKSLITIIIICFSVIINAQENQISNSSYDLGDGISFSFNEGNYLFNIYGFIRPALHSPTRHNRARFMLF